MLWGVAAADEMPDIELLEFLADWHDGEGEILDPAMFDDRARVRADPPLDTGDDHAQD